MEACDTERHWHCEARGQHAGEVREGKTGSDRMCGASGNGTGSMQLDVVLQVWSKSSQVREEAWPTVCRASENSRIYMKHSLAIEPLSSQGKSLSWITEAVHCASMSKVAAKLARNSNPASRRQKHLLLRSGVAGEVEHALNVTARRDCC